MPPFTDTDIQKIIEQAAAGVADIKKGKETEPFAGEPIDDENNPDVPKGGRWGITGMGQTPQMFRQRVGVPGLKKSPMGKVKPAEAQKTIDRIEQVEPDEIIAYSRGAGVYNLARAMGLDASIPVTYMAPSSYRGWTDAAVPPAAPGSKTIIGDKDTLIPFKQAAKNAVAAGTPLYVLPGYSHTGIMYSQGQVTPDSYEIDPNKILADPELPDWGAHGVAPQEDRNMQNGRIRQHIKNEIALRRFVQEALGSCPSVE